VNSFEKFDQLGPPKRKDRMIIGTFIGIAVGITLVLIAFVLLSDFPGTSHGSSDKTNAPPEDVSRVRP
jgi:hypothetical protein